MLRKYLIIAAFFSVMFSACENSTEVDTELPYTEYTVINAELSAGKVFDGVMITHTLPLGIAFDIKKAEIKDAVVYLLQDDIRVIPLHYTSDGLYNSISPFTVQEGSQYELFAEIGNKSVYSKTVVPAMPEVVEATNAGNQYLTALIKASPGVAYGAAWIVSAGGGGSSEKAAEFNSIETADHFPSNVLVRTQNIPSPYNTPAYSNYLFIQVYAFDKAYRDYFLTKTSSDPVSNTFTSGGGKVTWNVYGKDVIGLFIGMTEGGVYNP
jgi:hypothetical protein